MQINLTAASSPYFLDLSKAFTQQLPLQDVKINCDTSAGPIVIALPLTSTLPFGNVRILVNDSGNAATNNITVAASGGNTINNASSYVISTNKGFARIQVGAGTNYTAVSSISNPGGNDVIEIEKEDFLTLVSTGDSGDLVFPAIYKITDVLEGLFIETYSANTFNKEASLLGWSVQFIYEDNYKGVYHSTIGAVQPGEIYSWLNVNYQNQTGVAMTPDTPDENTFDSANRFAALSVTAANYYTLCNISVNINDDLDICVATLSKESGANTFTEVKTLTDDGVDLSVLPYILNNRGHGNVNIVLANCRFDNDERFRNNVCNQFTTLVNLCVDFGDSTIYNNTFDANAILFNLVTGGGTLLVFFNHFGTTEASVNNGLVFSNFTVTGGGLIEIQSMIIDHNSYINNVTSSAELKIQDLLMVDGSYIDGFDCSANLRLGYGDWYAGKITDYTYSANVGTGTYALSIQNIDIANLTNIDLNTLNVYGKKGVFVIKHDFTTNPLLTTDPPLLYNFLPQGCWITNIKAVGDIDGASPAAELNIGMEGFPALITAVVGDFGSGETYDLISRQAPANRSLFIAATVDDITSGPITIMVEFTL